MADEPEAAALPEPGEEWRTYHMTPFGPGAIASLVRVIEVVKDLHGAKIVRYARVLPEWEEEARELPLRAFMGTHFAPYEGEDCWREKSGLARRPVGKQPDEGSSR